MTKDLKQELDKKISLNNIKVGDSLSRLSYINVIAIGYGSVEVKNEEGLVWTIQANIVEKECYSASHFDITKAVTRSELIDIFNNTGESIYTVCFNKQPKVEDAFDAIKNDGKLKSNAEIKKALMAEMKGEERILVGYTIKREIPWGRSMVVDLGVEDKNDRIRQVDHRTLNWLICRNVRYEVR